MTNWKFFRAAPWATLEGGVAALYGFSVFLILGTYITPDQLGAASAALAVAGIMELATSGGLQEAVIRTRVYSSRFVDAAFTVALGWAVLGYGLSLLGAQVLAHIYGEVAGMAGLTAVAALAGAANTVAAVPTGILVRKMRGRGIFLRTAIGRAAGLTAILVLAMRGAGAWAVVWGTALSAIAMALTAFSFSTRLPRPRLHLEHGREIVAFGFQISLENFFWGTASRLFLLLFGHFQGVSSLGLFQFALRLVDEVANLLQAITNRLGLSYFAALIRQNQDLRGPFTTWTRVACLLSFPVMGGLILFASDLIGLFSDRWQAAAVFVPIVAVGWLLGFPWIFIGPILRARGRQPIMVMNALVSAFVIVGSLPITASLGPVIASLGWISRHFYSMFWGLVVVTRHIGVGPFEQMKTVLPATLALIVAMTVTWWTMMPPLVALPVYLALYLAGIALFEPTVRRWLAARLREEG